AGEPAVERDVALEARRRGIREVVADRREPQHVLRHARGRHGYSIMHAVLRLLGPLSSFAPAQIHAPGSRRRRETALARSCCRAAADTTIAAKLRCARLAARRAGRAAPAALRPTDRCLSK